MVFNYDGRDCRQQPGEVIKGLRFLLDHGIEKILEIGYWQGGLHKIFMDWGMSVVSVDLNPQGEALDTVIKGDSRDPDIIGRVDALKPYDVVFIDGDHSYEGVSADIKNYGKLPCRFLIFDDFHFDSVHRAVIDSLGEPDQVITDWSPDHENNPSTWNGWAIFQR